MAENEKTKLYREIVQQTTDEVLLERMALHGFWAAREGLPQDPAEEAAARAEIEKEMAQLRKVNSVVKNPNKALAAERKRRWDESKKRRAENKKKRAEQQTLRREQYTAFRGTTIVHAGVGVSGGLQNTETNVELLTERGLPVFRDGAELAAQLGIKLSVLRWLTYHRSGATVVHYHRFEIAKKTGGVRCISAPKAALAHAQRWILDHILAKLEVEPQAHGFVPGRSIVSNATPHAGHQVVLNLDVQDFFPSITFRRVKGLFRSFGYSEHASTVLGLLCTEPPRLAAEVDGKIYYVALGERMLPQGACTSPAITNALCRRLDRRLVGLATRHGFQYTRYADDLTLSGDNGNAVGKLLRSVRAILLTEGFTEHPSKTRVMRPSSRQEVTGVTVNARPQVAREELRRLRAVLYNAARHGLESQNRAGRPNFAAYLKGKVEYACMVDPRRAAEWRGRLAKALGGG